MSKFSNIWICNPQMSFECEQCGKKFDEMRRCQSHMYLVHREARHMCRYCGKMFKRRCDLLQHERRHRTPALPCKVSQTLPSSLAPVNPIFHKLTAISSTSLVLVLHFPSHSLKNFYFHLALAFSLGNILKWCFWSCISVRPWVYTSV